MPRPRSGKEGRLLGSRHLDRRSRLGGPCAYHLLTCKALEIDPQVYLRDVLDRISTHPHSRLNELLPDQWKNLRATAEATDPGG